MRSSIVVLLAFSFVALTCKKEDPVVLPEIKISDSIISVCEDAPGESARISVSLSNTFEEEVTVDYTTVDSTAVSGENYESLSGTLVFAPGVKTASFNITILHDTANKQDLYFKIQFSNPVNAQITNQMLKIKLFNVDFSNLVWSDEFGDNVLNTAWWNYEQGNNNGWGNNELEVYTNLTDNVHLDSGYLHITALNPSASLYTSGRITTLGKKEYTYGRIEIRAKMPVGRGIWPALWTLGPNITTVGWPKCGEIDIMEYLGHQPDLVYGTVHWEENGHKYVGSNKRLSTGSYHEDFHVFTLIWTPDRLRWLVDNQQYYEREKTNTQFFPFDLPQFLIFNVAVGGNWPGYPDGTTTFPQHMIVDYVRWYQ
ncbi:MAG TPA: family 16 glycosylhydrolase [Bacteroidales bacterium]|nr:family 16 glycosylhydrolase [Bacteroidales bacterium]